MSSDLILRHRPGTSQGRLAWSRVWNFGGAAPGASFKQQPDALASVAASDTTPFVAPRLQGDLDDLRENIQVALRTGSAT